MMADSQMIAVLVTIGSVFRRAIMPPTKKSVRVSIMKNVYAQHMAAL